MYKLNNYVKHSENLSSKDKDYEYLGMTEFFRLRKDALHYLFEIVQSDYQKQGWATEVGVGCLHCYKSEKTADGKREITEILIKVEK